MDVLLRLIARLWTNWITLMGAIITTAAALGTLVVLADLTDQTNPYTTTFLLITLPGLFVVGLLMIPVGLAWQRRRGAAAGEVEGAILGVLRNPNVARSVAFVMLATLVNMAILAGAGEKTVKHMSSNRFCGTTCHTPMEPEWEAFKVSPHASVDCVACHVGTGVIPNIKAKINGINQLIGVVTDDFARPVPSPVAHMRQSAETCLHCHSTEKYYGAKAKLFPHFAEDQENTPSFDAMRLFIGGRNPRTGQVEGIHAHADPNKTIKYETLDKDRRRMGRISVYEKGQLVAQYVRKADEKATVVEERTMDCLDCHNRPAHQLELSARHAVDEALYAGALDKSVPFISQVASQVLTAGHPARADAPTYFKKAVAEAYAKDHADEKPSDEALGKMSQVLADIYLRNVFPDMKVEFGTYAIQTDHRDDKDQRGCFRCHDGDYEAVKLADGRKAKLDRDCEVCHATLATEANPSEFDDTMQALFPAKD